MKKLFCLFAATLFLSTNCGLETFAATSTASKKASNKNAANKAKAKANSHDEQPVVDANADVIHALNRMAFGPRPGDIEHVKQIGIERYIDEQLNPQPLADPFASDERFQVLNQNAASLIQKFQEMRKEAQQIKKQEDSNKTDLTEAKRAIKRFYMETEGAYKAAKLQRAIDSPNQLQEVMTDFWYNHFMFLQEKGLTAYFADHTN
ncbi:MAG TPA: DUF1800 family protein, partial [Oculatellaceae cyanobacterium]